MGIPKFFRWISERYPLALQPVSDGTIIPEFENLYLDFNGIIHTCSHPDGQVDDAHQLSESEMILKMFEYVQVSFSPSSLSFLLAHQATDDCSAHQTEEAPSDCLRRCCPTRQDEPTTSPPIPDSQ